MSAGYPSRWRPIANTRKLDCQPQQVALGLVGKVLLSASVAAAVVAIADV